MMQSLNRYTTWKITEHAPESHLDSLPNARLKSPINLLRHTKTICRYAIFLIFNILAFDLIWINALLVSTPHPAPFTVIRFSSHDYFSYSILFFHFFFIVMTIIIIISSSVCRWRGNDFQGWRMKAQKTKNEIIAQIASIPSLRYRTHMSNTHHRKSINAFCE